MKQIAFRLTLEEYAQFTAAHPHLNPKSLFMMAVDGNAPKPKGHTGVTPAAARVSNMPHHTTPTDLNEAPDYRVNPDAWRNWTRSVFGKDKTGDLQRKVGLTVGGAASEYNPDKETKEQYRERMLDLRVGYMEQQQ